MEDKSRLTLRSVVSDKDSVQAIPNDPQKINASTPADVELTAVDTNPDLEVRVASGIDELPADNEILSLPLIVDIVDQAVVTYSHDTRLASNRSYSMLLDGQDARQFAMNSNVHQADAFTTYVDMLGQPILHHLIRENRMGFITLENGNRILVL